MVPRAGHTPCLLLSGAEGRLGPAPWPSEPVDLPGWGGRELAPREALLQVRLGGSRCVGRPREAGWRLAALQDQGGRAASGGRFSPA